MRGLAQNHLNMEELLSHQEKRKLDTVFKLVWFGSVAPFTLINWSNILG